MWLDAKDNTIDELRELVAKLNAPLAEQAKRIEELALATAKAQKDSTTSSKPPSSDVAKPKPNTSQDDPRSLGAVVPSLITEARQPGQRSTAPSDSN